MATRRNTLSVVKVVREEVDDYVYLMETSSGTFVSDKICHHNCQRCNRFSPDHIAGYSYWIVKNKSDKELTRLIKTKEKWKNGKIKPFTMQELKKIYNENLKEVRKIEKKWNIKLIPANRKEL